MNPVIIEVLNLPGAAEILCKTGTNRSMIEISMHTVVRQNEARIKLVEGRRLNRGATCRQEWSKKTRHLST